GHVCSGGACQAGCFVNGMVVASGAIDPANPCMSCQPGVSTTMWAPSSDGTSCGTGKVCSGGACGAGCYIGGKFYLPGAVDTANPCEVCTPGSSTSEWTNVADGTGCGQGVICNAGACSAGCYVGGAYYGSGSASPSNACQTCQPAVLTTGFTPASNGTSCGAGQICGNGTCAMGCAINGMFYASG